MGKHPIECDDCGAQVRLEETPYRPYDYRVTCDCRYRGIDVTDCVGDNSMLEPISGAWSSLDDDESLV